MPCRLSSYSPERTVRLWQQGKTPAQITKDLAKEDIWTTRCTVTKGAGLEDQRRSGRPLVITKSIAKHLDRMLEDNGEVNAMELHR